MLTGWTDEAFALVGNRIPVPLEELDDDLWREIENDQTLQDIVQVPVTYLFRRLASEMVQPPRK